MTIFNAGRRFGNGREARLMALWVWAATAGLLALGFRRDRYASPSPARNADQRQVVRHRGRGRLASTPSEIPPRGWKDVLLRVWKNIGEDRVMLVAAGVTFYSLLAIFPAIAALVALYGLFADASQIAKNVDTLSGVFPSGALDVIRNQMNMVASQGGSKLGIAFVVGFAVSLWSAKAILRPAIPSRLALAVPQWPTRLV